MLESFRLLQPGHAGIEDGPGGSWGAGEDQSPRGGTAHGSISRHMDTGGVAVVHLPLYRHPPHRGKKKYWTDPRINVRTAG